MFKRKAKIDSENFSDLISPNSTVNGTIEFVGTLKVSGVALGSSIAGKESTLILDENGSIQSEKIHVKSAKISGNVTSKELFVESFLHITSTAKLTNVELYFKEIQIDQGAYLNGCNLHHVDNLSTGEQT